jgi:ABC-type uncharacterized transport system substrate-binding protein
MSKALIPKKFTLGFAAIFFITTALLSYAPVAVAQHKMWYIGWLDPSVRPTAATPSRSLDAFRQALVALGYEEGRTFIIDARFADTDQSRLPTLAKELVELNVDVIVTIGTPTVRAAKKTTTTIPIIMAGSNKPVENGLVASLAHPGGNVTGLIHNPAPGLDWKELQLLKEAAPNIARVALLFESGGSPLQEQWLDGLRSYATSIKLTLLPHDVRDVKSSAEYDLILSKITEERADAIFVHPEFVNVKYQKELIDFVSTNKLPSICQDDRFVEQAGLLSYYTDWLDLRRRAAFYVDKIFKGAKPSDLAVEQPSRFELIVNMKTAHALGLTLPHSILVRAARIIQ